MGEGKEVARAGDTTVDDIEQRLDHQVGGWLATQGGPIAQQDTYDVASTTAANPSLRHVPASVITQQQD